LVEEMSGGGERSEDEANEDNEACVWWAKRTSCRRLGRWK
jgi:hypothetical protein